MGPRYNERERDAANNADQGRDDEGGGASTDKEGAMVAQLSLTVRASVPHIPHIPHIEDVRSHIFPILKTVEAIFSV